MALRKLHQIDFWPRRWRVCAFATQPAVRRIFDSASRTVVIRFHYRPQWKQETGPVIGSPIFNLKISLLLLKSLQLIWKIDESTKCFKPKIEFFFYRPDSKVRVAQAQAGPSRTPPSTKSLLSLAFRVWANEDWGRLSIQQIATTSLDNLFFQNA